MATGYRSIIIVLTCLYATAGHKATANPVPPPDVKNCKAHTKFNCCMPYSGEAIVDFTFPPPQTPRRVRRAAHLADEAYIERYSRAVKLMKERGPNDPWNFMQQANILCAYSTGAYNQSGTDTELNVQGSWLFFPFHRAYLYFYERILGKLIGDDTFAIPYWNWDHPDGMMIPEMYCKQDASHPLYDPLRDTQHQRPTIADLNFDGTDTAAKCSASNLRLMYRQMVRNGGTAELFLGAAYRAGDQASPGGGAVESVPRGAIHGWTGDRTQEFHEHMGNLYAAGRDPVFYSHHANVDRMWEMWRTLPGANRKDFNDTDWLDSSFLFWDENHQLVRIRVRDVVDARKLGYSYQEMDVPWRDATPVATPDRRCTAPCSRAPKFPLTLNKPINVPARRKKINRSADEKAAEEEVLVVEKIRVYKAESVKFDVYINADANDRSITVESAYFAGSFVHVPEMAEAEAAVNDTMRWKRDPTITTSLMLALTDLLDDINADGDWVINVALAPKITPAHPVTIGGIRIDFSS